MLDNLKGFWRHHVIQEVPVEIAACEFCGVGQCPQEKWLTCPNRIFQQERETVYRWAISQSESAPYAGK